MNRALIVFAKEPRKAKVKTRLAGYLSETECLKLYKKLLTNTISLVRSIKPCRKIMAYDSGNQNPVFLKIIASEFEFYKQEGSGLGERLLNTFRAFSGDKTKTIIIGSDSPGLPRSYITRAFNELKRKDLVLGPAYDGGYYLIGLKKPCREIFEGIKWSSDSVFNKTMGKAKKLKLKTAILDFWFDIDKPEDLKYLNRSA